MCQNLQLCCFLANINSQILLDVANTYIFFLPLSCTAGFSLFPPIWFIFCKCIDFFHISQHFRISSQPPPPFFIFSLSHYLCIYCRGHKQNIYISSVTFLIIRLKLSSLHHHSRIYLINFGAMNFRILLTKMFIQKNSPTN